MAALRVLVTGGTGFLGSHVVPRLEDAGHEVICTRGRRQQWDLVVDFRWWLTAHEPALVVHLAYPGGQGISTSVEHPADLMHDLLQLDLTVIEACARANVPLICMGSVCAYPERVTFPTAENQLWWGYPEWTNAPYGVAKRTQLELLSAYARQYNLRSIHLILGNLYGPGDRTEHVIPATIRKCLRAIRDGADHITVWGTGKATREFLYVDDAAKAIVKAVECPISPVYVNVCSGEEVSIASLALRAAELTGFKGAIQWDPSKPDGQPRRWFDNARAFAVLGWQPTTAFEEGLRRTVDWIRREEFA